MVADLERFCALCWRWPNGALSDIRLVILSLTMYTKRHVVLQHVVAMSHCRSIRIEGLAYKQSDRATSSNALHDNTLFGVLH
jgi:hypothetical protein